MQCRSQRRRRTGQGTVEFALMLPLAFAMLFAVIEYSYYFGAIHYTNYATFAAARAIQGNAVTPGSGTDRITEIEVALLNGNVTRSATLTMSGVAAVQGFLPWEAQTPGFMAAMGDTMDVDMTVVLGKPECEYEGQNSQDYQYELFDPRSNSPGGSDRADFYTDNGLNCEGKHWVVGSSTP